MKVITHENNVIPNSLEIHIWKSDIQNQALFHGVSRIDIAKACIEYYCIMGNCISKIL